MSGVRAGISRAYGRVSRSTSQYGMCHGQIRQSSRCTRRRTPIRSPSSRTNSQGGTMDLYVIRRRHGWKTPEQLQETAARSGAEGDKPGSGVRWIRSYVVAEESGELGTVCIYEAESPEALRKHAASVPMGADEIIPVADTVVVRPDPQPAAV